MDGKRIRLGRRGKGGYRGRIIVVGVLRTEERGFR